MKKGAQRRPSTNPAPTRTPEVYFRILYVTPPHGKHSQPEYRLTVEVALGPWRAFENGNIGRLKRVVPPERLVSAVALPRRLKRLVADLVLDKQMLQDVLSKKL